MRTIVIIAAVLLGASCSAVTNSRLERAPGAPTAACAMYIARAHAALAGPHDPASAGLQAAAHAQAMAAYHACLARSQANHRNG
jgi:hypothetical protein